MTASAPFRKIVVYGAGGNNIGFYVVKALIADSDFKVTVLARSSSKSTYPSGVKLVRVGDDLPHDELVKAFRGQDAVISCVGHSAKATEYKIVEAILEAGVNRFFPSEYGLNNSDPVNADLCPPIFGIKRTFQAYLKTKESEAFSWTAIANGMWLDWALRKGMSFTGADVSAQTVTYWTAEGEHSPSWSTLPFTGASVVEALKHPKETANKTIFVREFEASQYDIVKELERQQGVTYKAETIDAAAAIKEAKRKVAESNDVYAKYVLVQAGFLRPEYKTDFVKAKEYVVTDLLGLPTSTLQTVVKDALKQYA